MPTLVAVVPVRRGSIRVEDKNFRPFAGQSLLELKLDQLKRISEIDEIIVNTDSPVAIDMAKRKGIGYHERQAYYASSECINTHHWRNLAETTHADYIMHTLCTSPLICDETYREVIDKYRLELLSGKHDSVNTVSKVKKFMWRDGMPLNYDRLNAPNSQDLPNIYSLTFGISIISREKMLQGSSVVGETPYFYALDEIEAVDIDTPIEFDFAEYIYSRRKNP